MLNKFFLRGIQSVKLGNTLTFNLMKFSVIEFSKINKKNFCTNEQIINNTQEIPKEDIAKENAIKQTDKTKGKKPEKIQNSFDNKIENNKEANNQKVNVKKAENSVDFDRKLKYVKDHLKNKSRENNEKYLSSIENKFSSEQKKYLDFLVKKYIHATESQVMYMDCLRTEKAVKEKGENYLWNNIDWVSLAEISEEKAKNVYKSFIDQQTTISEFTKWLSTQPKVDLGLGISPGQAPAGGDKKEEKKIEEKKEAKKKEAYDIELTSFDPAKKIALIKEIRGITNLGLKEAKELVEKAPTIISKAVKTEEAEALMKKLVENGAKITLK